MTKRIFAFVLALVLSMSLFAVDVFAADFAVTATVNGKAITATWNSVAGATEYHASLFKDGVKVGTTVKDITALSYTFNVTEAGTYTVKACPIKDDAPVTGYSAATSNAVTVTETGSGAWTSNGMLYWETMGEGKYDIYFVNSYGNAMTNGTYKNVSGNQFNLSYAPAGAYGVVVYVAGKTTLEYQVGRVVLTAAGSSSGSVTVSGSYLVWTSSNTGTFTVKFYSSANALITTYQTANKNFPLNYAPSNAVRVEVYLGSTLIGSCYLNGSSTSTLNASVYLISRTSTTATIGWQNLNSKQYYVKYTGRSGSSVTLLADNSATSITIPADNAETVQIEITAVDGIYRGQKLTATLTPNGMANANTSVSTNTGNLYVTKSANGYTVSWTATGTLYQVAYKKTTDATYTTLNAQTNNSVLVPYTEKDSWTISVAGYVNGVWTVIGTYTANASSTSTTTGTTTTTGNGCTVVSSSTSSTVTWAGQIGITYTVVYSADGQTARSLTTQNSSITLPIGNKNGFTVFVLANNQIIASAEVKKATSSSSSSNDDTTVEAEDEEVAYDTVTGLWAETLGDSVVKLSWNAVEDADTYKVYYRKAGTTKWSGGSKGFVVSKTSLKIKFKNSNAYEFKVVAGKEESTVVAIKPAAAKGTVAWAMNPESDADFETNLAAVVKDADNGKITFTWDEAKGGKYKVYYRKAGTTSWKLIANRTTESITITFKSSNIDKTYEIKVVADGKDSDIFTLTPAVWANAD